MTLDSQIIKSLPDYYMVSGKILLCLQLMTQVSTLTSTVSKRLQYLSFELSANIAKFPLSDERAISPHRQLNACTHALCQPLQAANSHHCCGYAENVFFPKLYAQTERYISIDN